VVLDGCHGVESLPLAIFDVPQRFRDMGSRQGACDGLDGVHAMFHEAATRGWDKDELRQLARMWAEESGTAEAPPS
jgi:hypothetical protein